MLDEAEAMNAMDRMKYGEYHSASQSRDAALRKGNNAGSTALAANKLPRTMGA